MIIYATGGRMRAILSKGDTEKEMVAALNMLAGLPYEFMSFDFGNGHEMQEIITPEILEEYLESEIQSESDLPNRVILRRR